MQVLLNYFSQLITIYNYVLINTHNIVVVIYSEGAVRHKEGD